MDTTISRKALKDMFATIDRLHKFIESVGTRLQGCSCWDVAGLGGGSRFIGCTAHNSDDPEEWCVGCEARAITEAENKP